MGEALVRKNISMFLMRHFDANLRTDFYYFFLVMTIKLHQQTFSSLNWRLKATKDSNNLSTVKNLTSDWSDLRHKGLLYSTASRVLGTPAYVLNLRKDLFALIRSIGHPVLMVTLTRNDSGNAVLIKLLAEHQPHLTKTKLIESFELFFSDEFRLKCKKMFKRWIEKFTWIEHILKRANNDQCEVCVN